jgi:hypothetical protein
MSCPWALHPNLGESGLDFGIRGPVRLDCHGWPLVPPFGLGDRSDLIAINAN